MRKRGKAGKRKNAVKLKVTPPLQVRGRKQGSSLLSVPSLDSALKTALTSFCFCFMFFASFMLSARLAQWRLERETARFMARNGLIPVSESSDDAGAVPPMGGELEPLPSDSLEAVYEEEPPQTPPPLKRRHYIIRENDTFYTALRGFEVPPPLILQWYETARKEYDLTRLKPGQSFFLYQNEAGEFVKLEYLLGGGRMLVLERDLEGGFQARMEIAPLPADQSGQGAQPFPAWVAADTGYQYFRGEVENNFYDSALVAGMTPTQAMTVIKQMGNVNFGRELHKGDRFSVIFGPPSSAGGVGPLLAAMVETGGRPRYVFRFQDGKRIGYYDEHGKSAAGSRFLCPVRYRRISSRFTYRRFHPILHRWLPHLGVDYAAPVGAPVKAAASGRVIFAGWIKGLGRSVIIQHNQEFKTQYSHLSRYARGLKKGKWVRQGQVIGYVGSSGLSTGPHLDYRVYRRGKPVNPLLVTSMPGPPVEDEKGFAAVKERFIAELSRPLPAGPPPPWPLPEQGSVLAQSSGER